MFSQLSKDVLYILSALLTISFLYKFKHEGNDIEHVLDKVLQFIAIMVIVECVYSIYRTIFQL